ncbi:acyltransferase [Actinomadura kijaniata]|uniref:Peptidoglycan/LPS O-acetylase OafA/YrhL n=1 Tax=Actinomadura namibiensis TaxID=182080 RepID=A0A7W3LNR5_ACTNM|nr:acyltransferase [Actinomadura namibiensis]MBA8951515.1 peptidoglycan/LPS O-acetylase OafA/YrhL [Actinomadura namibiensis]
MTIAPERAGRLPRVAGHHDALDGVRAVAALAVLVFHVAATVGWFSPQEGAVSWLLSRGEIGVTLFFVLSGFLLYRPWAAASLDGRPRPRVLPYLRKRAFRVLPAYWLLVLVVVPVLLSSHLGDAWTWTSLLTLTFVYDPGPWWNRHLGPDGLGQIWSLCVEVAFYLTLPLVAGVLDRYARRRGDRDGRARALLRGLAVYAALSAVYTVGMFASGDQAFFGTWLPRYCAWFAAGMALTVLATWARGSGTAARLCRTVTVSWGSCWLAAALLYCAAATPLTGISRLYVGDVWVSLFNLVLYGAAAVLFVAPVALAPGAHPVFDAVLGNRVMRYLGRISYGIFLWQFVAIHFWFGWTGRRASEGGLPVDLPGCLLLTVVAAALTHHLVEEPVRRLGARLGR